MLCCDWRDLTASAASVSELASTLTMMSLLPLATGTLASSFAVESEVSRRAATTMVLGRARTWVTIPLPIPRFAPVISQVEDIIL